MADRFLQIGIAGASLDGTRRPAELLVLDHAVPDVAVLLGAAARPHHRAMVRHDENCLTALAAILGEAGPVVALHLVSHGAPGRLRLGAGELTRETLERRPAEVAALAAALAGAPVILYGCAVGAGHVGRDFVEALAAALDAPVRASSTPTGAAARGGDWAFDVGATLARPLLDPARLAGWGHLLGNAATSAELTTEFASSGDGVTVTLTTNGGAYVLGAATVNSIDLVMGAGVTTASIGGGPITPAGAIGDVLNVNLGATQTLTMGAVLANGGGVFQLSKNGDGVLVLTGTNTYTGTTGVFGGTLRIADDANLGTGLISLNVSGSLEITGPTTIDNAISLGSTGSIATNGGDVTLSGVLSGGSGLTKTGADVLTLTGTNTYFGTTTVSAGTLSISADANLGSGAVTLNGGTLAVTAAISIDNAISLGAGNGTVSGSTAITLSGSISGAGALSKTGTGTLTLTGTNTYTGTTNLAGGTLLVNGSLGNTAITAQGTTTLGGSGSIVGSVTVQSGSTLAPGSSPGQLETGSLTLDAGAVGSFEINGTTAGTLYDQVVVTGAVDVTGATLTTTFGFTSSAGNAFTLIDNDGVDAITGTFAGLAEGASFSSGGRTYQISYVAGTGNDVVLTDITASGGDGDGGGGSSNVPTPNADVLTGTVGSDTIAALASGDSVQAGAGADLIYGNQGADTLIGDNGVDTLYGGQDADLVYGNQGADVLHGNRGADTLFGGQDGDLVYGNQQADLLHGNAGADTLYGGQDADTLYGGDDADLLHGNLGDDVLYGGQGDDLLFGDAGTDRYAFVSGDGADTVTGFSAAEGDVIAVAADVNGTGIASAADLLARLTSDAGGNAVLDLGAGNLVTLSGVPPGSATAEWFLVT